jgi:AbrB family looped-hinge helix DNA binding protein
MERFYATFSSKGQLVIPAAVRDAMGIEPGTRVAIRQESGRLILEPETLSAKLRRIEDLRGRAAGRSSGTEMLLEDRRREREREAAEGW